MSTTDQTYDSVTAYPYDLGKHHYKITTNHPDAQTWFDRGLTWLYGFNLDEATRCFQAALKADSTCPMAAWGLAYALGPHYNFQWTSKGPSALKEAVAKTHAAANLASSIALTNPQTTPSEAAMANAIQARYPSASPPSQVEDFTAWNRGYADAMRAVYAQFPHDLDIATFHADAMLNLTPWKLWDISTGAPAPGSRAREAQSVLETALAAPAASRHPGLQHMYIHLMEMSPTPEAAIPAANNLRALAPDCGHLVHMASHIDVLVGAFDLATKANVDAMGVDRKFLGRNSMSVYTNYALHNITSLVYAGMMAGASGDALGGCDRLEEILTDEFLRIPEPNMADFAEAYRGTRPHVLVRFGRWREILALEMPQDVELYSVTLSTLHYAKGVAHAALGEIKEAEHERMLFLAAYNSVSEKRLTFPNKSRDVLAVARAMLDGELEYRKGNFEPAFEFLDEAIALEDKLLYSEPPGWMLPARHAGAALLLEQGRVRRAGELYAEDLGVEFDGEEAKLPRPRRHPGNMWALQGFHECLVRLGKEDEAKAVEGELQRAKRGADVDITSSCFCRLDGQIGVGEKKKECCRI